MFLLTILASLIIQFGAGPCGCEDKPQVNILAVVNGVKIRKQELGSATQSRVNQLQEEVIKARNAELDRQINSFLLEAEAKRRGVTSQQLLKLEVSDKVAEPTQEEAKAFYNQHKERMPGDFKAVKAEIIALLNKEANQAYRRPEVKARLNSEWSEAVENTPAQFASFVKSEVAKYQTVVKEVGYTGQ